MQKKADRRRALVRAARSEAAEAALTPVMVRVGQVIWYVGTYPLRLLGRAIDAL
jgi:hypothetical protein